MQATTATLRVPGWRSPFTLSCLILCLGAFLPAGSQPLALTLKEIGFLPPGGGKVVFSHAGHMKKPGIAGNCKSCHSAIFPMGRAPATMARMEKGGSCGACHNGRQAFALNDCARCHRVPEVKIQVAATGPVRFSHKTHLKRQPNCTVCHDRLFAPGPNRPVGMAAMAKGRSCGACHNGKDAFNVARCTGCHPAREVALGSKETGPIRFGHRQHLTRNDCSACHPKPYRTGKNAPVGMARMKQGRSCGVCHDGKVAFAVARCASCHPVQDRTYPVRATGPVTFRHDRHLEKASCGACHRRLYPPGSRSHATMAQMQRGRSCGACHNGTKSFGLTRCSGCHPVRDIAFAVKPSRASFSHQKHLAAYDCRACHPGLFTAGPGVRRTMAEMEAAKSCGACHDGKVAFTVRENCGSCHQMQRAEVSWEERKGGSR